MLNQPYLEKDIAQYELSSVEDVKKILNRCVFLESVLAGFVHGPADCWPEIEEHTAQKIEEYARLILPKDHVALRSVELYGEVIEQTVEFVASTAEKIKGVELDLWQILCLSHQYLLSNVFIRFSISYLIKFVPQESREYFYTNYFNTVWKEYCTEYKELKEVLETNLKMKESVKDSAEKKRLKAITDPEFLSFPWALALNLKRAPKPI